ncbi:hypothetical protein Hanom_Chr01g00011631 [Helianthus anomalus]
MRVIFVSSTCLSLYCCWCATCDGPLDSLIEENLCSSGTMISTNSGGSNNSDLLLNLLID